MPRFLCVWLPNWPIQRLVRTRPELKRRPLAILREGPRGGLVAACSRAAAALGIHPNMPRAEAQALAPHVVLAPHDPAADRRALQKLAEACEQFTPFVALEDPSASTPGAPTPGEPASAGGESPHPESLLLDITNLQHLHGSEHQLASRIKSFFTRRGYHTRIAIAETIAQAWALAHFAIADCGFRIADYSDQSPIRNPKSEICLPIESLRIPTETAALLHALGIQTVLQLQQLPRDDLAQRFGDTLLRRLDQFTGAAPETIQPHRAVAELEVSYDLEEPTADRAVLTHVFNQLLHRLCRRLTARDQGAILLLCILHPPGEAASPTDEPFHPHGEAASAAGKRTGATAPTNQNCQLQNANCELQIADPSGPRHSTLDPRPPAPSPQSPAPLRIALVEPTANPQQLLELLDLHLETLTLNQEVVRVQIRAAAVGRLGERQGELFTDCWPSDPHQLALLINRLTSRLGHDQVLRAELRKSPVPERAVRWKPMTGESRVKSRVEDSPWRKSRAKRLRIADCRLQIGNTSAQSAIRNPQSAIPLLLHPRPHPIKVLSVAPDGPPQCIWLENRRQQIIHHVGPERIETLWWRGPTIRRDYYRVATDSGNHLWIFRRLSDANWFLHGVFA